MNHKLESNAKRMLEMVVSLSVQTSVKGIRGVIAFGTKKASDQIALSTNTNLPP